MIFSPKIASFLELGYFLDYSPTTVRLPSKIEAVDQTGLTQTELLGRIRSHFLGSVEKLFKPGQTNVVPLSGGLDSRAVLGALLEFTDSSNIVTYTYGLPGSFDFEIAGRVARQAGIRNMQIPLKEYDYTLDELLETSAAMDHQTLLFYHAPLYRIKQSFAGGLHWSGFLGEAITGDHIRGELATGQEEAIDKFIDFNRFIKGGDALLLSGGLDYSRQQVVIPSPARGFLTFEEGLDLLNRQNKYIAPHVMLKGFEHAAPFNDPALMALFLGLTEDQKRHQGLFKQFLQWWQPVLFSLPVKNNVGFPLGAARWKPKVRKKWIGLRKRFGVLNDPNINYFNFSGNLIESASFRHLVWSQLADLMARKLWDTFNLEEIWKSHLNKTADHGKLIQGLFSLEVHLKAGKQL